MTSMRRTEVIAKSVVSAFPDFVTWSHRLTLTVGDKRELGIRPWSEVQRIELFPGLPLVSEPLVFPEMWLARGPLRPLRHRSISILAALHTAENPNDDPASFPESESIRRALLALFLLPTQSQTRLHTPSGWLRTAHLIVRLASWILHHRRSGGTTLWSHLTREDWLAAQAWTARASSLGHLRELLVRLSESGRDGILADYPKLLEQQNQRRKSLGCDALDDENPTDIRKWTEWKMSTVARIGNYRELALRPWNEVKTLEIFPGVRLDSNPLIVPEMWLPPGNLRRLSYRTISIRVPTSDPRNPSAEPFPEEESIRRTLFALWFPRNTLTGVRRYNPTSWLNAVGMVLRLAEWILANRRSGGPLLWSHLTVADWVSAQAAVASTSKMRSRLRAVVRWLVEYGRAGVIGDYPRVFQESSTVDTNAKTRTFKNVDAPTREIDETHSFQPFDDAFVTELLWRAMWLNENLSVQLIDCWKSVRHINDYAIRVGRGSNGKKFARERRRHINSIDWRDASSNKIAKLPFGVSQVGLDKRVSSTDAWPPESASTINLMIGLVQALNICLLAFCTGARISELGSARPDSLIVEGTDARFHGRTYKLHAVLGGVERDWPLHPVAAKALQIQNQLREAAGASGTDHIWVQCRTSKDGKAGSPLRNLNEPVVSATNSLGLNHLLYGIRPHAHRWRHTVARLVALSVVGAPQVLMDLFGHRDFEMTLTYMLSHPEIAQEAIRVAKETSYALAIEAVVETVNGTTGGKGAHSLAAGLANFKMRNGEKEFGTSTLNELAEVLTVGGRYWQLVRPGVICTKTVNQYGPCVARRGEPDPGDCRTDCGHRVELERTKAQCGPVIQSLIKELQGARSAGRTMLAANLSGQLLAHLKRWNDIREHWLSHSSLAYEVWSARKGT